MYSSSNKIIYVFTICYFTIASLFLLFSFPFEDALILFRYSSNFASSNIISFNINGLPTEGATDFLWMIVIGGLAKIRVDPAISALILNSIGFYLILHILFNKIVRKQSYLFYLLISIIFINIGPIIASSIGGFSILAFFSIGLMMYVSAYEKKLLHWTIFSICFCLLRPEGVIFFIPTFFIILLNLKKNEIQRLLLSSLVIILSGLLYFIFRYFYFGEFLPLPLMVKKIGGELSFTRFITTFLQVTNTFVISMLIVIFIYLIKNYKKINEVNKNEFIIFAIITFFTFIYLFSVSTTYQSQNIFFRYFAHFNFILFIMCVYALDKISINKKTLLICFVILGFGSLTQSNFLLRITNIEKYVISHPTYKIVNQFNENNFAKHPLVSVGYSLKKSKEDLSIMLTEAGAIPYISEKKIIDMAGLNFPKYAKQPVSCKDFTIYKPDLIEFDIGLIEAFNVNELIENSLYPNCGVIKKDKLMMNKNFLDTSILKYHNEYNENQIDKHKNATVIVAAENATACLLDNKRYNMVFLNKKSDQIYLFSSESNIADYLLASCSFESHGYILDMF